MALKKAKPASSSEEEEDDDDEEEGGDQKKSVKRRSTKIAPMKREYRTEPQSILNGRLIY